MELVGFERSDFTTKDGNLITGNNVYITNDIAPSKGQGLSCERYYISDAKAKKANIDLEALIGQQVKVYFNKYHKVETIVSET